MMMVRSRAIAALVAPERRRERLSMLGLRDEDETLSVELHDRVVQPHVSRIIDAFYDYLLGHTEFAEFLNEPAVLERLKVSQADYLLGLGLGFSTLAYWQNRLRIGFTHARVGLPLSLYVCAYHHLQRILLDLIPPDESSKPLRQFVVKIMSLDMSLALETYHFAEVTELERSLDDLRGEGEHLRTLATTDPLTGVANRKHVLDLLERELKVEHDAPPRIAVLMIDLDHFKLINDKFGHLVGDEALRHVATRIESSVRTIDTVGRFGGEEFLVILVDTDAAEGLVVAERIRHKVADTHLSVRGLDVGVTLSIGLSDAAPGDTVDSLLSRADDALYEAKASGRNVSILHGGKT